MKTLEIRNGKDVIVETIEVETIEEAQEKVNMINEFSFTSFLFGEKEDALENCSFYYVVRKILKKN